MENDLTPDSQERRWWLTGAFALTLALSFLFYLFAYDADAGVRLVALLLLTKLFLLNFLHLRRVPKEFAPGSGIIIMAKVYQVVLVATVVFLGGYSVWRLMSPAT